MHHFLVSSKHANTISALLKSHAVFQITVLDDSRELFSHLAEHHYDAILLDVNDVQPFDTFSLKLALVSPDTALFLLATTRQRAKAVELLPYTNCDYLLMPITQAELTLKLQRGLEYHRLKRTLSLHTSADPGDQSLLALNALTHEILYTLQLDEALNIILEKTQLATRAVSAAIWLADAYGQIQQKQGVTRAAPGAKSMVENKQVFSLVQHAARAKTVALKQDQQRQRNIIALPLLTRGKLIGALAFIGKQRDALDSQAIQRLSMFCQQAAIALENATLFHELASAYIDLSQSREDILQHRNMLEAIFDSIADGLYILDSQLKITAVNRVESKQQGYPPETLIGRRFDSLEGPAASPQLISRIKAAIQTGQEQTWMAPDDETHPRLKDREFRIYPFRNQLSQTEQVVVFVSNISEQRQWQASLFRSANLASVGQLAGSVAHQINNPLTVTMTNSQLLMLDYQSDPEVLKLAQGIFKAGERIHNIVTNLLEFSNQEDYQFCKVELVKTIEDALALVTRPLQKANVQLIKNLQFNPVVYVSISHLKLVWINLLLNARDATVGVTDSPAIRLSTEKVDDSTIAVTVADNGSGITAEHQKQLFRPFFTTKPLDKALGLGLYAARAIVDRHGGQIQVKSAPGHGAEFKILLPLKK